jgi:hypothetical protein
MQTSIPPFLPLLGEDSSLFHLPNLFGGSIYFFKEKWGLLERGRAASQYLQQ